MSTNISEILRIARRFANLWRVTEKQTHTRHLVTRNSELLSPISNHREHLQLKYGGSWSSPLRYPQGYPSCGCCGLKIEYFRFQRNLSTWFLHKNNNVLDCLGLSPLGGHVGSDPSIIRYIPSFAGQSPFGHRTQLKLKSSAAMLSLDMSCRPTSAWDQQLCHVSLPSDFSKYLVWNMDIYIYTCKYVNI